MRAMLQPSHSSVMSYIYYCKQYYSQFACAGERKQAKQATKSMMQAQVPVCTVHH
jgi:hypothetical protein